jgi:hypothetical protein
VDKTGDIIFGPDHNMGFNAAFLFSVGFFAFPQALKTSENKVTVVESTINILSDSLQLDRLSGKTPK